MPQVPADSSNSVATQKALVKTRRTKQEQKDGGNKMSREGDCAGWWGSWDKVGVEATRIYYTYVKLPKDEI